MPASLPAAVAAFMEIAAAALPSDFLIRQGQVFNPYIAPKTMLITGAHFTEDDPAELGPVYKHEEHYAIQCTMSTSYGTDDPDARMAEVYDLYKMLASAVNAKPTLNGTVRVAWTTQLTYTPTSDSKGMTMGVIDFEVKCEARVDPTS